MNDEEIREGMVRPDKIKEYENLTKRLIVVNTEIAMGGYLDGWTLNGYKKEKTKLIEKINNLII